VTQDFQSFSSNISGLLSDSDDEIIQMKQDVAKPQSSVSINFGNLQVYIRVFTATPCCATAPSWNSSN
jgi:hypothetical protein